MLTDKIEHRVWCSSYVNKRDKLKYILIFWDFLNHDLIKIKLCYGTVVLNLKNQIIK